MKCLLGRIAILVVVALPFVTCQPASSPVTPPGTSTPAAPAPPSKPAWEQKWETVLSEARKEGSVSVYSLWGSETRIALTQAFKEKYGISMDASPFGRGAELMAKVRTENAAGINIADVFGSGAGTFIVTMKPAGLLGPIEPLLILPEIMSPNVWRSGAIPFMDKDKLAIGLLAGVDRFVIYNKDMVREGEITSYKDVLKPQYKGKIVLDDPTIASAGNIFLSFLAYHVWKDDETVDFLRQLVEKQEAAIVRPLNAEPVARGKYAIGLAPLPDSTISFVKAGAPVGIAMPKEGTNVGYLTGGIAVPIKLAHPNAGTAFVNWVLSKEGQTVFSKSFGTPSLRADVPTEGLLPFAVPQAGEKLFFDNEEFALFRAKWLDIAKSTIEQAKK